MNTQIIFIKTKSTTLLRLNTVNFEKNEKILFHILHILRIQINAHFIHFIKKKKNTSF